METYLKDLRWGRFNLIKGDMISNIACAYGEWSDVEVEVFQQILSAEANVVEVGSNIGMHAVPLAKFVSKGKLICFEPQRIIFQQLCCNLALNNLTNVETYRMGVGDKRESILIEDCDYSQSWNYGSFSLDKGFSTESNFGQGVSKQALEVVNLDDFAPVQNLERLDLLKVDAEGFDIKVLEGARQTIERFKPMIFIEIQANSYAHIWEKMTAIGYKCYWVVSERYQKDNFYQAQRIAGEYGVDANFLCIANSEWDKLFAQHSTAQHSTAQHSTAQHSTAQHSTAQQDYYNFYLLLCQLTIQLNLYRKVRI
ncbi:hypothetical protein A4G20_01070 [Pasteurellaceae bacterium RH1A]|nr:hypothetical protein A4G20_01070 [Pasteurellaceae bacterium RH1A]